MFILLKLPYLKDSSHDLKQRFINYEEMIYHLFFKKLQLNHTKNHYTWKNHTAENVKKDKQLHLRIFLFSLTRYSHYRSINRK
ncbi:hypothetical protein ABI57_15675 [Salmonella enterica subsp. enterica serovar Veneziana]|nr:hypothetical protein ABI57_15675 [Salmonella enterica subsp. enterica serovar Veneziana]